MNDVNFMRDPTSEASTTIRSSRLFPNDLEGKTIALLDISKERSSEFLDHLEPKLSNAGFSVRRYRKASHSKVAATNITQAIVQEADIVVESLAD
ncbi:MAG: hypothetical protein HKP41_15395 [Desulfobacterales bacterium]|nr:hypothetical protein [Desulfobacterales bacterium]RZW18425.1 MAG: hypothetical protein EX260_08875 [Desulfobulbaceae bacterium]